MERRNRLAQISIMLLWLMAALPSQLRAQAVDFETVAQGAISQYRYDEPESTGADLIIKDQTTWKWFWQRHTAGQSTAPEIDFESEIVIVAILGWQPTGGPRIDIQQVEFDAACQCIKVHIEDNTRQGPLTVITNPYHIIKLIRLPVDSAVFEHHRPREAEAAVPDR